MEESDDQGNTPSASASVIIQSMSGGVVQPVAASGRARVSVAAVGRFDETGLRKALGEAGLEDEDVADLLASAASDESPVRAGEYGPKTSSWLARMISKAASGALTIGAGAAAGLLTEVLDRYFGLK
jgi:hypothetical protein